MHQCSLEVGISEVEFHEDRPVSCIVVCFALEGSCHGNRGRCASRRCDCCGVHETEDANSATCCDGSCGKPCFLDNAGGFMEVVFSCLGSFVVGAVDSLSSSVLA